MQLSSIPFNFNSILPSLQNQVLISLTDQQKRIAAIAIAALVLLAACFVFLRCCFKENTMRVDVALDEYPEPELEPEPSPDLPSDILKKIASHLTPAEHASLRLVSRNWDASFDKDP